MSGICGIVRFDGAAVSRAELDKMVSPAVYRGPNGITYFQDGAVGVVCLSLDTLRDGRGVCRPLVIREAGMVLVADARIDNRQQFITDALAAPTDAEIILDALIQSPAQASARLLGDFAYACWNHRQGRLTLARDAMGMRSLYYRVESNRVLFATEISQLLAVSIGTPRINDQTVARYFTDMQVPGGHTFYQDIDEVRPGEEVVINTLGAVARRNFWQADPGKRLHYADVLDYEEHFRELMCDVMRARLATRSSMGISLSGGMDSSTAASVAGWLAEQGEDVAAIKAYSWSFTRFPECDERENIYKVANRYAIPVREIAAEETYPLVDLEAYRPHRDDPYMSIYHAYMHRAISAASDDRASGMLFGFRGDLMCGEAVFDITGMLRAGLFSESRRELARLSRMYGASRLSTIRDYVAKPAISDLVSRGAAMKGQRFWRAGHRLATSFLHHKDQPPGWAAARVAGYVRNDFLGQVGLPARDPQDEASERWPGYASRQRYQLVNSPLASRVVQFSERLCARYGMAFCDPWSDRRVVEFVLACPQHIITRPRQFKRLAKRSMAGIMPTEAIYAAHKVSPEPMYLHALREEASRTLRQLVTDSRCVAMGYVDERLLHQGYESLVSGERDDVDLWPMLSLELWLRHHWS